MEQSMLKRLEASEIRFAEVEKELLKEDVMKDMRRFRDLSKERATLGKGYPSRLPRPSV